MSSISDTQHPAPLYWVGNSSIHFDLQYSVINETKQIE